MSDKYKACISDADLVPRLTQAHKELHNALVSGLVPMGYWTVQIYEDAIAEIERLRADNATLSEILRGRREHE